MRRPGVVGWSGNNLDIHPTPGQVAGELVVREPLHTRQQLLPHPLRIDVRYPVVLVA